MESRRATGAPAVKTPPARCELRGPSTVTQILLYEFITGGGMWSLGDERPSGCLLSQGRAMAAALAADLQQLKHVSLIALHDDRLDDPLHLDGGRLIPVSSAAQESDVLQRWAAVADATILIAPEFAGQLFHRAALVERCGGRLLSPDSAFIRLAADKRQTRQRLRRGGIRVPQSCEIRVGQQLPADFAYPAVLKPRDGAGSVNLSRFDRHDPHFRAAGGVWCLEKYHAGIASSVALLCGPRRIHWLPACGQRLSDDGRFQYLGGVTPLPPPLNGRAHALAAQVASTMPATTGYVGVDMVLGEPDDGSQDYVIEINPRLTTSYLGLRQLAKGNLAAAMLAVASGRTHDLSFSCRKIEFGP